MTLNLTLLEVLTRLNGRPTRSLVHETPIDHATPRTNVVLGARDDFDAACTEFDLTPARWPMSDSWYAVDGDLSTWTLMLQYVDETPPEPAPAAPAEDEADPA